MGVNYNPCVNSNRYVMSIHAECDALQNLRKLNKHRRFLKSGDGIDVVVVRISKNGKLGYSRPCKSCIQKLTKLSEKIKINNVYYSDSDGSFKKEKFKNMYNSPLTKLSYGDTHK